MFQGIPPPNGIYVASWLRQFVRSHHDLPIVWPNGAWCMANGEWAQENQHQIAPKRPMIRLCLKFAPHAVQLLKARAEADGEPQAAVLRRLLVQHFGRVPGPAETLRVTGGDHVRTPGQGPDCTFCRAIR